MWACPILPSYWTIEVLHALVMLYRSEPLPWLHITVQMGMPKWLLRRKLELCGTVV